MEYIIDQLIVTSNAIEINLVAWITAEELKLVQLIRQHHRNQAQELWLINSILPTYIQACIYRYINALAIHIRKQHKRIERCTNFLDLSAHLRKQIATLVYTHQFLQQYKELKDFCTHIHRQFHTNVISPPNEIDYRMIKLCMQDEYCNTWFVNDFCQKYNITLQTFNMSGHYYSSIQVHNFTIIEPEVDLYSATLNQTTHSSYNSYNTPYQQNMPYQQYQRPIQSYQTYPQGQGYDSTYTGYNIQTNQTINTSSYYDMNSSQQQFNYPQQSQYPQQPAQNQQYYPNQQGPYNQYQQQTYSNFQTPYNNPYQYDQMQQSQQPYTNYQQTPLMNQTQVYTYTNQIQTQTIVDHAQTQFNQNMPNFNQIETNDKSNNTLSNNDNLNNQFNDLNFQETNQSQNEPILKKSESLDNLNSENQGNVQDEAMQFLVVRNDKPLVPVDAKNIQVNLSNDASQSQIVQEINEQCEQQIDSKNVDNNVQEPAIEVIKDENNEQRIQDQVSTQTISQSQPTPEDLQIQENKSYQQEQQQVEEQQQDVPEQLKELENTSQKGSNDNESLNKQDQQSVQEHIKTVDIQNPNNQINISQQQDKNVAIANQQVQQESITTPELATFTQDIGSTNQQIQMPANYQSCSNNSSDDLLNSWVVIAQQSYLDQLFQNQKPIKQQLYVGGVPNLPTKVERRIDRNIQGFQNHDIRSLTIAQQYSDGVQAKENYKSMIQQLIK